MPHTLPMSVPAGAARPGATLSTRRDRQTALAVLLSVSLAATLGVTTSAQAGMPWSRVDNTARGRLVDVQIEVAGQDVPLYPSPQWDARRYFEASRGQEYAVTLHNTSDERVGVLVAVDGLNVITGKRTGLGPDESMYVLDPHGSTTIRGWRTSLNDIRRFVFVDEERSYASRSDQANGDLGWVRVLAFRENQPLAYFNQPLRAQSGQPCPPAAAPENASGDARDDLAPRAARKTAEGLAGGAQEKKDEAESNPGTGWGRGSYDPVREVEFVAQRQPLDRIVLRYEYEDGLRALGIRTVGPRDRTWQRDRGELGFAQPPRW